MFITPFIVLGLIFLFSGMILRGRRKIRIANANIITSWVVACFFCVLFESWFELLIITLLYVALLWIRLDKDKDTIGCQNN